jgi:hypothetical protein
MEMEFTLHVVLYTLEGEDRFKVMAATPDSEEPMDVTNHYEVVSIQTPDGRCGFATLPKIPAPPEGPPNRLIPESEGG